MISPDELKVPEYIIQELNEKGIPYEETTSLEDAMPSLDILYMTRVQQERFFNAEDYLRLKDSYILTPEKLETAKQDLCILHPLPRVNEISVAVDDDPRACYFKQVANGKYIRMALILKLLELAQSGEAAQDLTADTVTDYTCTNPRCITSVEQEIPHLFKEAHGEYRCIYCEAKA